MKRKILVCVSMMILLFSFAACGSGPEMPMEVMVDGFNIVLGETTMQELIDQGYNVNSNGSQDVAKDGDKFISFYYSLDKGAGHQFWVTVCVPWSGNNDISAEQSSSATEGIIRGVSMRKSAAEDITITYNGINLTDMSFEKASEWGAKENNEKSVKTYELTAKLGFLTWESVSTSDEEFNEMRVLMRQKDFNKMQE